MEYRNFGQLDWKVSALGFGAMRLPTLDGKPISPNIDESESIRMIRHAIDQGVNYLDTAYVYHDGNSETLLGKALEDGYRDRVRLATKSPVWFINSESDFDKFLNEQLAKLRTDCIDYYLLHALDGKRWQDTILKYNVLEKAEAAIRDGRIRYLGFSFHGSHDSFAEIVEGYDKWTFCQIQYNYMDIDNQAGTRGLKLAASKGLAVVVMEPLLGGRLSNPPASIREIVDTAIPMRTPTEWALQWLWDQPEVSVILSGMSNMNQVEENIDSASRSRINSFSAGEFELIEELRQKFNERTAIPCTSCSYCMPCPNGVDIPANFKVFNDAHLYDDIPGARFLYNIFFSEGMKASSCTGCQTCEPQCPQSIPISEWLPKVHTMVGEKLEG